MPKSILLSITFVFISSLCGCASQPENYYENVSDFNQGLSSEEKELLNEPQWGLALSGGGFRSAAFQLGVLKYLYDLEGNEALPSLGNIDLISSVSGGGYLSHLMYTTYEHKNLGKKTFGHFVFDDAYFSESLCDMYTKSNFVAYPKLLWAALPPKSQMPREYYEQQIRRTFGFDNMSENYELKLSDLVPMIRDGSSNIPYPIINYTISDSDLWQESLYEVTPLHQGNETIGYYPWDSDSVSISRAVTISAAAVEGLLKQDIQNPSNKNSNITVYDGGGSENLGAIALIRRRIPKIIISDAEHDPDLTYSGRKNLLEGIKNAGFDFKFKKDVEFEKEKGFTHIEVNFNGVKTSDIYYIKMQLPKDIFAKSRNPEKGYNATEKMLEVMRDENSYINCKKAHKAYEVVFGKDMERNDNKMYAEWLKNAMLDYEFFLNTSEEWDAIGTRMKIRLLNLLTFKSSFFDYSFPHISTADQNFYIDQTLSFVGLGYAQAESMVPYISNSD